MIDLFSGAESREYHSQVRLFYCSMDTAVQRTSTPVPNAKPVHITFVLVSRLNKVLALGSSVFVMNHFYDLRKYLFMLKRSCREVLSSVDLKTANSNEPDQY